MGIVMQAMADADVLFTRNPASRAAEPLVEASWGLGEAVVPGTVTPVHYEHDIEFAFAGHRLYLLRRRPISDA